MQHGLSRLNRHKHSRIIKSNWLEVLYPIHRNRYNNDLPDEFLTRYHTPFNWTALNKKLRLNKMSKRRSQICPCLSGHIGLCASSEIRTRVLALKGLRPGPLDDGGNDGQNFTTGPSAGQDIREMNFKFLPSPGVQAANGAINSGKSKPGLLTCKETG